VIAFIFQSGGQNRTICLVTIAENMTIKRRTTGFGLKRLGDGVAASVLQGDVCRIFGRGGFRHSDFETRRTKAIEPPGPRQQKHENQTMDERVGAQVARGVCMGGHSDLPLLRKKGTLVLTYGTYLPVPCHSNCDSPQISLDISLGFPPHHLQWN